MGISYSKDLTIRLFQANNLETQKYCLLHSELIYYHDTCYFIRLLATLPKWSKLCNFIGEIDES